MKIIKYISFILLITTIYSCEDFVEPTVDFYEREWQILGDRDNFRGLLYYTYASLPNRVNFEFEAATDNAVTNNDNTSASRAARGGISFTENPLDYINQNNISGSYWTFNYTNINMLNFFLEKLVWDDTKSPPTPVRFELEPVPNEAWFWFLMGEAYFMRAWFQFDLLQKYGGVASDGKAYGFPIVTKYLTVKDELDLPRNTYQECVDQIIADCDMAIRYLAFDYSVSTQGGEPEPPMWEGGVSGFGHASGLAAMSLKAKALLYAASPAYNVENDIEKWKKAAIAAGEIIGKTGFNDLMSLNNYFVDHRNTTGNNAGSSNADLFFRGPVTLATRNLESENFPPRAGGSAVYQPTQNLIDAFPMLDGYPINNASATNPYDEDNMYANRDPRLATFILYNGQSASNWGMRTPNPTTIETLPLGADAFGSAQNATRTGYYLKKWLGGHVMLTGNAVTTNYTPILFGRPELYLNFAEAVIQATGNPDDKTYGYSAREVLAKVRNRALGEGNDKYLPTISGKDAFLNLVKNERRIELCFENHRFWDLRRWSTGKNDVTEINTPVYGIYTDNPVESRQFSSPYLPLPYSEMLKTENLVNNDGW